MFNTGHPVLAGYMTYQEIREVGEGLNIHNKYTTSRHQMCQREIELEVEIIRAAERPTKAEHRTPFLKSDISNFVHTSSLPSISQTTTFEAFKIFEQGSFAKLFNELQIRSSQLSDK